MVRDEPERRQRLWSNQRYFVGRMSRLGYPLVSDETPIVPILIGNGDRADQLAAALRREGVHIDAILKNSKANEHIDPVTFGNHRRFITSELAGKMPLIQKAQEMAVKLDK